MTQVGAAVTDWKLIMSSGLFRTVRTEHNIAIHSHDNYWLCCLQESGNVTYYTYTINDNTVATYWQSLLHGAGVKRMMRGSYSQSRSLQQCIINIAYSNRNVSQLGQLKCLNHNTAYHCNIDILYWLVSSIFVHRSLEIFEYVVVVITFIEWMSVKAWRYLHS